MNIYSELILDHYQNPRNFGSIKNPSKKSVIYNPSCGDRIELDIVLKQNKIKDVKFRGQGCAISQASASILTDYVLNKAKEELKKLDKDFMIKLLGIELGPNRITCALLPLEALHKLI
ncbi:SUF system NifU family Fe-S cluster assembly protein [Candidatus Roizmanbacteria bacterium RIFCSPHIGHO2_02_FULL_37_15]|uniref:SUF system NifU family Fe-S cluster assembly protein n=1 Tax=Candidatus Roizmanbacteria bacterium RIFCSPLOWO2_01_FULL_37_16 TaxID=1802058 RepID=A0A1F7ILM3_9BACT|nr:MAG: SUF system NifU family Fe-S cluster assembly protein [Candidatus Roizmanbacteria bacterium RIFCSPHIGHO2_01_FULL_37_16b]OGK20914.1 MAG: SUF system NifU family Fe-S cluster assembly protein [Candidatus Roizmanbacteria bacterium RIFCSPHIGHO2_02_FULL_37_15]OGK44291.1 MAG: SUF system NifU family Fe-S cluster assembly protein [Candidatus Roizmanbacteria bacterium RIFCSPLOWO2_01_FULL_37_16]OGK57614.1 MAG: SUF system NifU family Fe-S cluster assembly protein [Candidatus Roizmanbacteria bacterium